MENHKIVIIGSGPAGLTAGLYTGRAQLQPLIFEGSLPGGQLTGTTYIENWPGTASILGPKLIADMKEHAKQFGAQLIRESIERVDFLNHPFTLVSNRNRTVRAESVIIATGATPRRLGCPGESEYWGKGVTTCAVCDGAFYRDKRVLIVGGGDTAMEDASFMTNFTSDITIVHIHDKLTASIPMQQRIIGNPAIKIIYESTVTAIEGNGAHVTHATITDKKSGAETKLAFDAIFVAVGLTPNTSLFKGQIDLNPQGYITYTKNTQTSVPGIFAAGDVADQRYRQAITSAGSGCMAALDAERFLKQMGH
jgi:thioredoxin reductase (NADPH)